MKLQNYQSTKYEKIQNGRNLHFIMTSSNQLWADNFPVELITSLILHIQIPKKMKNERNPEIPNLTPTPKKLTNFTKALSRNQQDVYEYILMMVSGDFKSQQNCSDYIFAHLKNIINNQMNTNSLKYASRVRFVTIQFITTLMLLGNIHIYERFIAYLLPIFKAKILDTFQQRMRPVWPIQLFCKELLFIVAMWLPLDFFDESKPSIFACTVKELKIQVQEFKFMTVDKIIISYRIIKALGLDETEQNCACERCKFRKTTRFYTKQESQTNTKGDSSNKLMREKLYVLQSKSNPRDGIFQTGFQITFEKEISDLSNMIENKFKPYNSSRVPYQQSLIFYRLRQKMEILEDDIDIVKGKFKKDRGEKVQNQLMKSIDSLKATATFQTPTKKPQLKEEQINTDYSTKASKRMMSPTTDLKLARSLPNLELLHLEQEFNYTGYKFFEDCIKLTGKQLIQFKHSLICFDQKIYLKKQKEITIYCIALAKNDKIKIRVKFQGEEDLLSEYSVVLDNENLNYDFNEEKYQFTIRLLHNMHPIKLSLCTSKTKESFILPLGYIKLLEPLPDSVVQTQKLTFKLSKTIKLQNKLIPSYEYLASRLNFLEKLIEKARSSKIPRLFQAQKLKKKLQRRYRLFDTQLSLTITNHQTQYIDVEILCQDKHVHRKNICELLKELVFLCSG